MTKRSRQRVGTIHSELGLESVWHPRNAGLHQEIAWKLFQPIMALLEDYTEKELYLIFHKQLSSLSLPSRKASSRSRLNR